MGGVILIFLMAILIVILVTPAIRAHVESKRRQATDQSAHDAVISRLEDHRKRRNQPGDRSDS